MSKIKTSDIKKIFENYEAIGEFGYKHFAVLLLLIKEKTELGETHFDSNLRIVYEVRAINLERQPGEICLPGGLIEKGESAKDCALRETEEELGIGADDIEIISQMGSIYSVGGSQIHCFLGMTEASAFEKRKLNENEVAEVFTVSVDKLIKTQPEMYYSKILQEPDSDFPYDRVTGGNIYRWRNGSTPVPVYEVTDEENERKRIIWGLTGRMTKQFLEVIKCSS